MQAKINDYEFLNDTSINSRHYLHQNYFSNTILKVMNFLFFRDF